MFSELITETQFGHALVVFALAFPVLSVVVGGAVGKGKGVMRGVVVGAAGPVAWLLWQAHLWFVERLGVDRWATVGATLITCGAAGVLLGFAGRWAWRR